TQRYGERGVRYVHIEVGHCAQNIHLEAVALGLASVPIGAFQDNGVKRVMNLPKNIDPLYIIPIGYPREGKDLI
ncbi:MAG: nitroreductase family protein, partial [Candidatus Hermodarchaeota archaeon]